MSSVSINIAHILKSQSLPKSQYRPVVLQKKYVPFRILKDESNQILIIREDFFNTSLETIDTMVLRIATLFPAGLTFVFLVFEIIIHHHHQNKMVLMVMTFFSCSLHLLTPGMSSMMSRGNMIYHHTA